nr:MAG TPA: hypothetical protein [Caudoviricetes sp.]
MEDEKTVYSDLTGHTVFKAYYIYYLVELHVLRMTYLTRCISFGNSLISCSAKRYLIMFPHLLYCSTV